jgi:hypothetical protein
VSPALCMRDVAVTYNLAKVGSRVRVSPCTLRGLYVSNLLSM